MNIVAINTCDYGSTGKIMLQIAETARKNGHQVYTFSRKWSKCDSPVQGHCYFGFFLENMMHRVLGQLTGLYECFSYFGTKQLIHYLKKIKPDVIHLHNLHGNYINLPQLFKFIKKNEIPIIWTLHDCWTFTGHCPQFDMANCEKWKTGCEECPQYRSYPASWLDNSRHMYKRKQKWFQGVRNMTLVTPSRWLCDLVKQSFLKSYPTRVINNGIDLAVFRPGVGNFRQNYNLQDRFIILGVAFCWGDRKGLDVFIRLADRLDERFAMVLVGTNEDIDKQLPKHVISIHKTKSQAELAAIYGAADLFVNPTREDNYPTVNMESLACGTPVITFRTGGSPEIPNECCGCVVEKNDEEALYRNIMHIYEERPYFQKDCIERAWEFDMYSRFQQYIALYDDTI